MRDDFIKKSRLIGSIQKEVAVGSGGFELGRGLGAGAGCNPAASPKPSPSTRFCW